MEEELIDPMQVTSIANDITEEEKDAFIKEATSTVGDVLLITSRALEIPSMDLVYNMGGKDYRITFSEVL